MKSKFCLESVASFAQINQATTNQSPTKHTFSFSKGSRFQQPKANCPLNTYGGDSMRKNSRGTGMGYGRKLDFTRCLTVSPSADKYNLKSFWDLNLTKKKGPLFALSRDRVSFNAYVPRQQISVPSSTHYNNEVNNKRKAPMYSLRQKTSIVDKKRTLQPQNNNPGPGSYINPQMQSQKSQKLISKFQNLSYSQSKSKRFGLSQSLAPGPGNYKEIQTLSKIGTYILSQNKGGSKAKFDQNKRQSFFDQIYRKELSKPGPGYYQAPSEFGQYDGNIYTELRENRRSKNGWRIQTERIGKI